MNNPAIHEKLERIKLQILRIIFLTKPNYYRPNQIYQTIFFSLDHEESIKLCITHFYIRNANFV